MQQTRFGIEHINAYLCQATVSVTEIFEASGLDVSRLDNLMMQEKSVNLPCEDPATNAVNAAKPLLDSLTESERNSIELLVTATESGLDFGKSLATTIHPWLDLPATCRCIEFKQACYAGTVGLQLAGSLIASELSPGSRALIIATDCARPSILLDYAEPSQGAGAIAFLVGSNPVILDIDPGAYGVHSFDVMDTFRPTPQDETGNPDLSLLAYLDCLDASYAAYTERVENTDFMTTFDHLALHTPFAGMVKGAHRKMLRQQGITDSDAVADDFNNRVAPSLVFCKRSGNLYSAALYLALLGLLDAAELSAPARVGIFSYGSGCSSEFFSGIITPEGASRVKGLDIAGALDQRIRLDVKEYRRLTNLTTDYAMGTKNCVVDQKAMGSAYNSALAGRGLLVLKEINDWQRVYDWS